MKRLLTVLTLCAVCIFAAALSMPIALADSGADSIYFFNTENSICTSDMILVQSNGHYGLIDASNRQSSTITDENGSVYKVSEAADLSNSETYKNGKTVAEYMIDVLGVTHLDFIIGTHAHSDHIGGVPEIAELDHNGVKLVDSDTVYINKEYRYINRTNDSLWLNPVFVYQAVSGMRDAGAQIAYTNDPASAASAIGSVSGLSGAYAGYGDEYGYDDYIQFNMGDYTIRLYNLYSTATSFDENVNSIVTVIMKGSQTIVSLADLNVDQQVEQRVLRGIYEDVGTASLVKVAHHGAPRNNNSIDSAKYLQPQYAVCTGVNYVTDAYAIYTAYCQYHYGTAFYSVYNNGMGICVDVYGDHLEFYRLNTDGSYSSPSPQAGIATSGWAYNSLQTSADNSSDDDTTRVWMYFSGGRPHTGWLKWGSSWYYMDEDGVMATGFRTVNNKLYYMLPEEREGGTHGVMATGWQEINGLKYFFYSSGAAAVGEVEIDGISYQFDENGVCLDGSELSITIEGVSDDDFTGTGWQKVRGRWYYLNDAGEILTGWNQIGGSWYCMNDKGAMQTGWVETQRGKYYLSASGAMVTGWNYIDGGWRYMDDSGLMQTGWVCPNGLWCYLDSDGVMATGWRKISDNWYYFDTYSGTMVTGWNYIDGGWRYMDDSGLMQTGWVCPNGLWCYLDADGVMATGWRKISDDWYYFDTYSGAMVTGWLYDRGSWYYLDASGVMLVGWYDLGSDGGICHFDESGALV